MYETKPWATEVVEQMVERKEAFDRTLAEIHALPVTHCGCPVEELV